MLIAGGLAATREASRRREELAELATREIAVIEEDIRATGGGIICILALIIAIVQAIAGYSKATTVFQQIEVGVGLMASYILFGLGAALGRRRIYRVHRSVHRVVD